MKSPITGKELVLKTEERELEFRKEKFKVVYNYFECPDSGMSFTDDRLDNLNLNQVYHQYRAKYGIPFTDEIRTLREGYGLSAAKMSEVMGFGANMWRQYEAGEMPTVANGRLIRMASDPVEFLKLLEIGKNALEPHEYQRVKKKLEAASDDWFSSVSDAVENWMFKERVPSIYNGYRVPDVKRIGVMVKYIAQIARPFTTAMNKLLFYADFVHFQRFGTGISGLSYAAIQRGPVPAHYGSVYDRLYSDGYFQMEEEDFGEFSGHRFVVQKDPIDLNAVEGLFSESEKQVLMEVATKLGPKRTKELVHLSHEEQAWLDNQNEFGQISYLYSFSLKALK